MSELNKLEKILYTEQDENYQNTSITPEISIPSQTDIVKINPPKNKCIYFLQGQCRYGTKCKYLHQK